MSNDPRGTIFELGGIMRINNALVEEVTCSRVSNRSVLVSYAVPGPNQTTFIQNIRLNVKQNTVILTWLGRPVNLCDIRVGDWVNVVFSSSMTRSIPPQSNAFLIVVQRQPQPAAPLVTTERIGFIDLPESSIFTGNANNINSQTRFIVTDNTVITNRNGRNIRLSDLRPGQLVRITHANFQTASIPPQTTAFRVQVL